MIAEVLLVMSMSLVGLFIGFLIGYIVGVLRTREVSETVDNYKRDDSK